MADFDKIWNQVKKYTFAFQKPYGLLDMAEKEGSNSYYSPNISKELIEELDKFLHTKNISELNTRVILKGDRLEVTVASAERSDEVELGEVLGRKVVLVYGEFRSFLTSVVGYLKEA